DRDRLALERGIALDHLPGDGPGRAGPRLAAGVAVVVAAPRRRPEREQERGGQARDRSQDAALASPGACTHTPPAGAGALTARGLRARWAAARRRSDATASAATAMGAPRRPASP